MSSRTRRTDAALLQVTVLAAAILIALPLSLADAQLIEPEVIEDTVSNRVHGFFALGWRYLDVDGLNTSLATAGFPTMSRDFISIGGGAHLSQHRFVLGFEGHGLLGVDAKVSRDEFDARLSGAYGAISLGWAALSTSRVRLVPLGSIGFGGTLFEIAEGGRFDFDELLVQPRRAATLTQTSLLLGGALSAELYVPLPTERQPHRRLAIGVEGGYTFTPWTSGWSLSQDGFDTGSVGGGPDVGISGPFARFTIGTSVPGGRSRRTRE